MNHALQISTNVNQPVLLQFTVERSARRSCRSQASAGQSIRQWETQNTATVEAFVDGRLTFNVNGRSMGMPFVAPFLFTCTQPCGSDTCKIAWSQSLS